MDLSERTHQRYRFPDDPRNIHGFLSFNMEAADSSGLSGNLRALKSREETYDVGKLDRKYYKQSLWVSSRISCSLYQCVQRTLKQGSTNVQQK